jgi:hypothetical protein
MIEGEISFEIGLEDLIIGGRALSPIVFRTPDGAALPVIAPSDVKPAYSCESCGYFMIVTDSEYKEVECLACKTIIPAGTSACPKCGWTYKDD